MHIIDILDVLTYTHQQKNKYMPVTKTAKRALRSSKRKADNNTKTKSNLEAAIRAANKSKRQVDINAAMSLADRAAKKNFIHKNKASRLKAQLSRLRKG